MNNSIRAIILLLTAALCAMCVSCAKKPVPLSLAADCGDAMLANSLDTCAVRLEGGDKDHASQWITVSISDSEGKVSRGVADIVSKDAERIEFKAGLKPGRIVVSARRGAEKKTVIINVSLDESDSDSDGFPDAAEINSQNDRNSFRMWFVTIAESQALHASDAWNIENRDCAGLVRFAYREALREHNTEGLAKFKSLTRTDIPDVRKFRYPDVPLIG